MNNEDYRVFDDIVEYYLFLIEDAKKYQDEVNKNERMFSLMIECIGRINSLDEAGKLLFRN